MPYLRWGILDQGRARLMDGLYDTKREASAFIREVSGQDGNPQSRYVAVRLSIWIDRPHNLKLRKLAIKEGAK